MLVWHWRGVKIKAGWNYELQKLEIFLSRSLFWVQEGCQTSAFNFWPISEYDKVLSGRWTSPLSQQRAPAQTHWKRWVSGESQQ
jgi:hypothetical protein